MPTFAFIGLDRQRGAGLIETLVGVTIGLIVVLVIYNLLAVAEGYKRMTTGQADAQITGLISHFVTGQDAGNGGNGLSSAYSDLINCHFDEGGIGFAGREDMSLKPIPVMITKGGNSDTSDSFLSRGSASMHVVWPVPIRPQGAVKVVPPGGQIQIQSPTGFMTPARVSLPQVLPNRHWAVTFTNDGTGRCGLIMINNATPAADMATSGEVLLTQDSPATTINYIGEAQNDAGQGAYLLSLGHESQATRVRYDISNGQLRATNCMTATGCTGQAPNPIAQNVVLMKVQLGIDTSATLPNGSLDGTVDCWTTDTQTCPVALPLAVPPVAIPDWDPATLIKAGDPATPFIPANTLSRIVAVRIGLVVRSDEPDFRDPALFVSPAVTLDSKPGTRPATGAINASYLFNCAANTTVGCPGRVPVSAGTAPTDIMQNGWRYRIYEAVIPLRNSIYAATLPP
jgi:hypothetical protein